MQEPPELSAVLEAVPVYRDTLASEMREIVLANAIFCGEIPSPTFQENQLGAFLCNRLTECGVSSISTDETGNAGGILPGLCEDPKKRKHILVAAHTDKIWDAAIDHTLEVEPESLSGVGIGDNSLGVAALASLPEILEKLDIKLQADLILLGSARSFGRGDIEGLRFFLENSKKQVDAGICIEGMQLERLSYACLGMLRGEIHVTVPALGRLGTPKTSGAIAPLNRIVEQILAIERPERPITSILLGSIQAGSTYNAPPQTGLLRFEVRSEDEEIVVRIQQEIEEMISEINAGQEAQAELSILARRKPGDIGYTHPLVTSARKIMETLGVEHAVEPSISELAALLDAGIPALTLGLTRGENRHTPEETVQIEPLFTGLAQLIGVLQVLDAALTNDESE